MGAGAPEPTFLRSSVTEILFASLASSLLGSLYLVTFVQAESSVAAPEKEAVAATGACDTGLATHRTPAGIGGELPVSTSCRLYLDSERC